MSTTEFITALFCRIDDALAGQPKHPQATLWPSEIVTLALLFVLKPQSQRAFYGWVTKNLRALFPHLPERTRLFRLFVTHQHLADRFLGEPTLLAITDSFGIELIHPRRQGRSPAQIGKKGISNGRWIVGVKWCVLLNSRGQIIAWDVDTANVYDAHFQRLLERYEEQMRVFADQNFHWKEGDVENLCLCKRGEFNFRMLIETVFSHAQRLFGLKKISQRVWEYVDARLSFVAAAYNLLISWGGTLTTDDRGYVSLSIPDFSL